MNQRKQPRQHLADEAVYKVLGISRATFYRLLEKGAISQPVVKIAKNRRGWTLADIELAKQELRDVREKKRT